MIYIYILYIYMYSSLSFVLGVEASKRRPFPIKTRVIWVPGMYSYPCPCFSQKFFAKEHVVNSITLKVNVTWTTIATRLHVRDFENTTVKIQHGYSRCSKSMHAPLAFEKEHDHKSGNPVFLAYVSFGMCRR